MEFGNELFKEKIKVKWGHNVGPNPVWLQSLQKESGHTDTPRAYAQREPGEDTVRRQPSASQGEGPQEKKQAFPHLDLGLPASRTIRFICLNNPIHDIVMAVPEGTTGMSE